LASATFREATPRALRVGGAGSRLLPGVVEVEPLVGMLQASLLEALHPGPGALTPATLKPGSSRRCARR
jgi:hypothetical protein